MAKIHPLDLRVVVSEDEFRELLKHLRRTYAIEGGIQLFVPGVCTLDLRVDTRKKGKVFLRPKPLIHTFRSEVINQCVKEGLRLFRGIIDNVRELGFKVEPQLHVIEEMFPTLKTRRIRWEEIIE